jgi:aldehyde:ferredoxin oxidoreductase
VFTKSPLTGCFNESYAGGGAAVFMSRSGFDAIHITGISSAPIWLEITENTVFFHSASDLWGLDCPRTEAALRSRSSAQVGTVVIGPAGENLVRFAVVATDGWHMAGRGGTGAVMGCKKLKGIAFSGQARRPVHNPEVLQQWAKKTARLHMHQAGTENYRKYGTTAMVDLMNTAGAFPSAYWSRGRMPDWESLGSEAVVQELEAKARSCPRCFLDCRNLSRVQSGPHRGLQLEGPEYETLYAFGGLCLINDLREVAYLNDVCDRLGMDTMSAGNLAGLAIEASRQGRIKTSLEYGHPGRIADLLYQMASRQGLGGILALGIGRAAQELGLEDLAVHVKGMEPAGYDPRVLKGMGLAYAVSSRGACHLRASFHRAELTGEADPNDPAGLVASFIEHEDKCTIMDSLIVCRFFRKIYETEFSKILNLCTGLDSDWTALQDIATETMDRIRMINIDQGLTAEDDRLPQRLFDQALPDGSRISREEMEAMLREYYRQRKWDAQGIPAGIRESSLSSP